MICQNKYTKNTKTTKSKNYEEKILINIKIYKKKKKKRRRWRNAYKMFILLLCLEFHCESKQKKKKTWKGFDRQLFAKEGGQSLPSHCPAMRRGTFGHDNCQLVCVLPSILNRLLSIAICELLFFFSVDYSACSSFTARSAKETETASAGERSEREGRA